MPTDPVPQEVPLPALYLTTSLLSPHMAERKGKLSGGSHKGTNPIRGHALLTSSKPNPFPKVRADIYTLR